MQRGVGEGPYSPSTLPGLNVLDAVLEGVDCFHQQHVELVILLQSPGRVGFKLLLGRTFKLGRRGVGCCIGCEGAGLA